MKKINLYSKDAKLKRGSVSVIQKLSLTQKFVKSFEKPFCNRIVKKDFGNRNVFKKIGIVKVILFLIISHVLKWLSDGIQNFAANIKQI